MEEFIIIKNKDMGFRLRNETGPLFQTEDWKIKLPEGSAQYDTSSAPSQGTIRETEAGGDTDSIQKQVGTLLSNPLDGVAALGNQVRGSVRETFGMRDEGSSDGVRGSLTNLGRAKKSDDAGTKKALENSSGLNTVGQIGMLGSAGALGAQTVNDLLQGDATGAVIKKAKVLKPIYNAVKKLGVDPTKLSKALYKGYKANKNVL